jgi:MFS family permease
VLCGLFGSIFPIGSMIGPIFGGLFVSYWTWRGIFFVNVPVGALLLLLGLHYLPGDRARPDRTRRPVDIAGLALLGNAWLALAGCLIGLGGGWSSPASRNACLQLVPDQSPALAALRSTGRQVGQIVAVSVTATIIAQPGSPGELEARVFAVFALLLVACLPVIARLPEHRGSW